MKLLGSTEEDVDKNKDGEIITKLGSAEVVQCIVIQSKTIINTHKKFYNFLFQTNNWTANEYFTTFFNDDEHSIFFC